MCGICGFQLRNDTTRSRLQGQEAATLQSMLDTLEYRGPDAQGHYHHQHTWLGHTRLAIIDVAHGQQPFQDPDRAYTLVYNGEIYNYREIRRELEARGRRFRTDSDTEVVLQSWQEYGEDCVRLFNGMFALAIWNSSNNSLFLARDRLGQKPLYYYHDNGLFAFASDIRALMAHPAINVSVQTEQMARYLQSRHVPGPSTILENIYQLPPAHKAVLEARQALRIEPYWKPERDIDPALSLDGFIERFDNTWPEVIRRHMISEVPLGGFLSGGIDSSLIALEAVRQNPDFQTWSVGFDDRHFDESSHARTVAQQLGCAHRIIPFNDSFEQLLESWLRAYDQPFSDPAAFPLLTLCRESRKEITVALAGDGADELFAGYQRYWSMQLASRARRIPAPLRAGVSYLLSMATRFMRASSARRRRYDAIARRLHKVQDNVAHEYLSQFELFTDKEVRQLVKNSVPPAYPAEDFFTRDNVVDDMLLHDMEHWLPDQMLVKTDRASMAWSLETRLPFLDNEIVALALQTPVELLVNAKQLKSCLREAAARHLPASITRRPKHGFAVPVDQWLRAEQKQVRTWLFDGAQDNRDWLDVNTLDTLWKQHQQHQRNHGEKLLTLLLLILWRQHHQI